MPQDANNSTTRQEMYFIKYLTTTFTYFCEKHHAEPKWSRHVSEIALSTAYNSSRNLYHAVHIKEEMFGLSHIWGSFADRSTWWL